MKTTSYKSAAEINWTLNDMGVLTISGSGRIPDYACGGNPAAAPWNDKKDIIEDLVIEEGITEIGVNAFRDCKNLKSVRLPYTVYRIHGYAFRNCIRLEDVESQRSEWRYIYDKRKTAEEDTVIFGVESFLHCPWAIAKWNNYYIQDDSLYVCFTNSARMEIPEGIRVLKRFSMADLVADEIVCPSTLEQVEAFAFSGTVVMKGIQFSYKAENFAPYALADCSFGYLHLPEGYAPIGMKKKRTYLRGSEKFHNLKRVPEFTGKYYLGSKKVKGSDRLSRLKIMERKPVFHKDGTITAVWDNDYTDVGLSVLRKLKRGSALVCVEHKDDIVACVRVITVSHADEYYETDDDEYVLCEYIMYPEEDENNNLLWTDSCTFFDTSAVWGIFPDNDGKALVKSGKVQLFHSDRSEEWFWCRSDGEGWQELATDALKFWLLSNPDMGG